MSDPRIVDFMCLIPESPAKQVYAYCLTELGLSAEDAERCLLSGRQIAGAIWLLLRGGDFPITETEAGT
jgi:hypothetical protein